MDVMQIPFSTLRDGLTIRGTMFRAPGLKLQRPAIVCHEFLESQKSVEKYAVTLAEAGFSVFTFDFCGGGLRGKSDGQSKDMTVLTELQDLFAVMDHARSRPDVKKVPFLLMGCSQGGFVSAMAAAQRPFDVAKLVLFYPALCIPDDARRGRMLTYRFDAKNLPETLGRLPMPLGREYARAAQALDAYEAIRGFEGPVLLVHGTADRIVKIDYSRRAAEVYGGQCRFETIPGGGHIFRGAAAQKAAELLRQFALEEAAI